MKTIVITGGAGFIGCHAVLRYAREGWRVFVVDNLSRKGSEMNLEYLHKEASINFVQGDIRVEKDLTDCFRKAGRVDAVLHLAAQVAVTTSVTQPRHDFEVNALGTFNVLEAVRQYAPEATVICASTNKVYGGLEHRATALKGKRYDFVELPQGVSEDEPLDFHSPYGCSKGAADQYVRDYSRIYGLRTFVIRQSCIYGTRQFGVEDQGWVAWFSIAAVLGLPVTVYGDGKQVRDLLWVEDLLNLYDLCLSKGKPGSIYNAGGGARNRFSILELLDLLQQLVKHPIPASFSDWRPGDQHVFFSDNSRAERELGWQPRITVQEGVSRLVEWVNKNSQAISRLRGL
jgi:CDP-paratose 2-epimerase